MKKLLVASFVGLAVSVTSSYGTGFIVMQSYDYINGTTPVYSAVSYDCSVPGKMGEYVGEQNGWVADLLYSPTGMAGTFSLVPGSQTPFYGTSSDGGTPTTDGAGIFLGGTLTISPYTAGSTAYFIVEAYNGGLGSSYGGAGVTAEGQSAPFAIANLQTSPLLNPGDLLNLGGTQAFPPTSTTVEGLQPFTVGNPSICPEPSPFALGSLVAALMIFRRRRQVQRHTSL